MNREKCIGDKITSDSSSCSSITSDDNYEVMRPYKRSRHQYYLYQDNEEHYATKQTRNKWESFLKTGIQATDIHA